MSRAAARAKLALQRDTRERIEFIVEYYTEEQSRVIFGEWQDWGML
jgi:hypothetical protein